MTAGIGRLRFDIPPGPLGAVLAAFEQATGLEWRSRDEAIRELASPGVSGLFTADQALERAARGNGRDLRFTEDDGVALDLRGSRSRST